MELELSLKITKVTDDLASITDLRLAKDSAGPLFLSTETDTKFILTAHLKGFRREKIRIEINEDGTRITIKGEKQVEEIEMVGWKLQKKIVEFKKVFQIPDGVILDRIKAKFNDYESILTINMPKSINGFRGVEIEEVNEEPEQDSIRMIYKQKEFKEEKVEAFQIERDEEEIEETSPKKVKLAPTTMVKDPETAIDQRIEVEAEKTELHVPPPEKPRVERLPDLTENVKKEEIAEAESKKPEEKGSEEQHHSPDKVISQSESPNKTSIQQSKVEEEQSTKSEIHQTEREMPPQEYQKKVEQPTEPPPTEKPLVEELAAGSKDEIPETESKKPKGVSEEVAGDQSINPQTELPNQTSTQQSKVEEEENKGKSPQVQSKMQQEEEESQKHETNTDNQERVKSEPDQELDQTETPHLDHPAAQEQRIEKIGEQEATHEVGNETQEAENDGAKVAKEKEVHEQESLKVEKQKGPSDQAAIQAKPPRSDKSRLFYAGSAFLVSIIVLVIHLIRSKKG